MARAFAKRLKLRLFLEGIEVPVISANIQTTPNAPMMASLQVPPLAEGTRLFPRTLVHLFFLDYYEQDNPFIKKRKEELAKSSQAIQSPGDVNQPTDSPENAPQDDSQTINNVLVSTPITSYKLLFGGEVIGFVWSKSSTKSTLILQCEDFSNYWDYAYQWNNTGMWGPGVKAMFSGGGTTLFTDWLMGSKGSAITGIVTSGSCATFPKLKGLAAGVIRLLEAIGGVYHTTGGATGKRFGGQNAFFSLSELRLHLTHMIGALEKDETSHRLLQRGGFSMMFERALGGLGGQVSIRSSINALTQIIFHEMYGQPCPKYIAGNEHEVTGDVKRKLKDDPSTRDIANAADNAAGSIADIADEIAQLALPENTKDIKAEVRQLKGRVSGVIKSLRAKLVRMPYKIRTKVQSRYSTAISALGQAQSLLDTPLRTGEIATSSQKINGKLFEGMFIINGVKDLTTVIPHKEALEPSRLFMQIFRPDIWFGAPPRCNVLFPENYEQVDYQRMYLQEPTRFMLKVDSGGLFGAGDGFLFGGSFYFAPQAGTPTGNNNRMEEIKTGGLMNHELFTGILPVFEKMGEFNLFASRGGLQDRVKLNKVGYAQRAANFIYFKHRFNSRQMRITGKFNPYIACGFPGLVIDKYVDLATIQLYNDLKNKAVELQFTDVSHSQSKYGDNDLPPQEIKDIMGTNFLGSFTQVTHSVSQERVVGRTEILCSYPRQPEESVEFLGTVEENQTVRKRFDQDAVRSTTVAALFPPKLFSLGPNGGRITDVQDVTAQFAPNQLGTFGDPENLGRPLPIYIPSSKRKSRKKPQLVQVGLLVTGALLKNDSVSEAAGDPNRPVTFRAFQLTEEIPRYRREITDLPAEEFIRPGWYGDVWSSSRIGEAYEEFFDIGAITDVQQISDPGGASYGVSSEKAQDAQAEQDAADSDDDGRMPAPAIIALDDKATIQDAVEFLLLTYSYIRSNDMDVDEFINAYTWRPIANLLNIFGSEDLSFSDDGKTAVSGKEGFHSRAFGPYDDLTGLLGPNEAKLTGISKNTTAAQKGDVRKRRFMAVQRFVSALRFSRALLA